jgi:quinohemoprotein ethanol dehydrogenase
VVGLRSKFTEQIYPGTVYTFALNGRAAMPAFAKQATKQLINRAFSATKAELDHGGLLYLQYCSMCHGSVAAGGGALPDLGYASEEIHKNFKAIVSKGLLLANGMPDFGDRLSEKDVTDIHNYVLATAKEQITKQKK